jgi:anti-sigma B factor antagonist
MSGQPLEASVRFLAGRAVIDLKGDINAYSEQALTEAYSQASAEARAVILNFSQLEYMNSSGIGLIVTLLIRANRQGKRLCAVGLSDHYKEIFLLTRLSEAIKLLDTEQAALAAN